MRRAGIFLLAVIALVAMAAPASAQPKVTINGLVDTITSINKNLNHEDSNMARTGDTEWYARMRVRPDITAEVGTTKFVLGLEIDYAFGQTAAQDTNVCLNAACSSQPQRFGTNAGLDQNTDTPGIIELKWAYTEFLLPLLPVQSVMRVGAQPASVHYKPGVLFHGDFVGIHSSTAITPAVRLNLTFNQVEEESTGARDGFVRGEDIAIIGSVEITPFKGLDIRPIYAYFRAEGVTAGGARNGRGGVANAAAIFPNEAVESRHTIGVDARWRFGAFSIEPTIFYQFGSRDLVAGGALLEQNRNAWFVDIRGGWQAGPLLIEGALIWTSGNNADDRVDLGTSDVDFYEPISTDSGYYGGWAEIWALNIDYFNSTLPRAGGLNTITAIGYDKYGLMRAGMRASYALTPSFTLRGAVVANWTSEEVDTSSVLTDAGGLLPVDGSGNARYLGTEVDLGFQWRFAPNVALDVVGAYHFAGPALSRSCVDAACGTATGVNGRDPQDSKSLVARIRYTF
jgi:hypothetical protein